MKTISTASLSLPELLMRKARKRKQLRTLPLPKKGTPAHVLPLAQINWKNEITDKDRRLLLPKELQ